jgi:hypothetical protein
MGRPGVAVARRERGFARDFANQLAQMAVGVEAISVGPSLVIEPNVGAIEIDAVSGYASINGRPVKLVLADFLRDWVIAELNRKNLDRTWLKSATITIEYSQIRKRGPNRGSTGPRSVHGIRSCGFGVGADPQVHSPATSPSYESAPATLEVRDLQISLRYRNQGQRFGPSRPAQFRIG